MEFSPMVNELNRPPVLTDTSEVHFKPLVHKEFVLTRFEPYTLMMERNHPITQIGYIHKGMLDVLSVGNDGQNSRKGTLGPGDFFGLEIFFDRGTALYDIFSVEPLECYIIDPPSLEKLLLRHPGFNQFLETCLVDNMRRFCRNPFFSRKKKSPLPTDRGCKRFTKIIAYIDANYMNPLTLDEIAKKAGLSRFYFSRMFKQDTGHSFKDYLNIKRMEAAKKILAIPDMNISQACYSVGFNDVSYFARIFKRYEKTNPSAYKRRIMDTR